MMPAIFVTGREVHRGRIVIGRMGISVLKVRRTFEILHFPDFLIVLARLSSDNKKFWHCLTGKSGRSHYLDPFSRYSLPCC
jgi:hypothetical protein